MNKTDVLNQLSQNTKLNKKICSLVLDNFVELIKDSVNKGNRIKLNGFGVWRAKLVSSRRLYSPNKACYINTKRKIVPMFKPSPQFRIRIN